MSKTVNQPTAAPTRKVIAGGVGGAVGGITLAPALAKIATAFLYSFPAIEQAAAKVGGIEGALVGLFTAAISALTAYMAKERA